MAVKIFDPKKLYELPEGYAIERTTPNAAEFYTCVPGGWIRDRVVMVENNHGTLNQSVTSVFIPRPDNGTD